MIAAVADVPQDNFRLRTLEMDHRGNVDSDVVDSNVETAGRGIRVGAGESSSSTMPAGTRSRVMGWTWQRRLDSAQISAESGGPQLVPLGVIGRPRRLGLGSARNSLLCWLWFAIASLSLPQSGWAAPKEVTLHSGMANASAAAFLGNGLFCVASDEDNVLRTYRTDHDGSTVASVDVSKFLLLHGKSLETDVEGAARVGDRIYWIGSHSRNKDGKLRPNRQRLFATRIVTNATDLALVPVGHPCGSLLDAMVREPSLVSFNLALAVGRPPELGGLNIEGLAAGPKGELWIGLRSPNPGNKALLIPLFNPSEAVELKTPRFGAPKLLDLDGLGIRDIAWTGRDWFLIAGKDSGGGTARLYRWAGGDSPPERIEKPGFKKFNPEALVAIGAADAPRLLVLSDDGNRGKGLAKQFRSFWVDP